MASNSFKTSLAVNKVFIPIQEFRKSSCSLYPKGSVSMILLSFIIKVSLIFDTSFIAFSKFSFLLPMLEPSERYTSFHFLAISTATSLSGNPTGAQGFLISNFTSFIKGKDNNTSLAISSAKVSIKSYFF